MDVSNTKPYHLPSDAVWFITGCSSGIGQALCHLIATKTSNRLVATARNPASLSAIPDGDNILKLALDVTSQLSVDAAIAAALAKFGRLDIVVNNAGYGLWGDTESATEEQARRQVETVFWGTRRISVQAMRIMREENPKTGPKGGVVLNVTSCGGFIGFPGGAFYHASKFAVEGFTEAVAKEVHPDWNIHFCIIEPGATNTNFASSSMDHIAPHPAYTDPSMPARMLETYMAQNMVDTSPTPEAIARAMYEVVSRGKRVPIRLPLGTDSWGMIKADLEQIHKDLEEFKEISLGVGDQKHAETLSFLRKDAAE